VPAQVKKALAGRSGRTAPEGDTAAVRNGCRKEETALTDIGSVAVRIPRIPFLGGKRENFISELIKPFRRRTPTRAS